MEEQENNEVVSQEREFDIRAGFLGYLRYWYLFAFAIVFAFGAAYYYNWYSTPIYGISAKLLIKDENYSSRDLLSEMDLESKSKNLENEIEILLSHTVVSQALDQLEFAVSYFLVGDIKVSEVYKDCPFQLLSDTVFNLAYGCQPDITILDADHYELTYELNDEVSSSSYRFGELVDGPLGRFRILKRSNFDAEKFNDPEADDNEFRIRFNTKRAIKNSYLSRLNIGMSREGSTILLLTLEDPVPRKGVDMLNKLVEVYLSYDIEEKNRTVSSTSTFIDEQLESITSDLRTIESGRELYKMENGIVDLSAESKLVLESEQELHSQISQNKAKLRYINYLESYVGDENRVSELAPSALDINDALMINLIQELSELEQQKETLMRSSNPDNPFLLEIKGQIKLTTAALLENIANVRQGYEGTQAVLEDEQNRLKNKIYQIPRMEREFLSIERQFRIQESLYLYLLEKKAEISISLASTVSDHRVIDVARATAGPIRPTPSRGYSIALLLGLLLPVGFIYIKDKLDDTINDRDQIAKVTNIPILGMIGFNTTGSNVVVHDKPRSAIAEAFRSIRTDLRFFTQGKTNKITLITSSVGTEGKTFSAINLSTIMAMSGQRTVLIGLDLRKPKIIDDFQLNNDKGVSTYLSGSAALSEITQSSKVNEHLDIITSGPIPPNPSELIMGEKMDEFIEELKERYDHIIIDSPPIGLVTDGLILLKYADQTIFVVRHGVTRKQHLQHVDQIHKQKKIKNLSILFNAVKVNRGKYGYGYGKGYGYGYGYGYFEDQEESKMKSLFKRS